MLMDYPPAAHMLSVLVSGENEELLEQGMDYLAKFVERIASRYRIPCDRACICGGWKSK